MSTIFSDSLWKEVATLLHEGTNSEPHAVKHRKLVLQAVGVWITRMGILPFVRSESVERTVTNSENEHGSKKYKILICIR